MFEIIFSDGTIKRFGLHEFDNIEHFCDYANNCGHEWYMVKNTLTGEFFEN